MRQRTTQNLLFWVELWELLVSSKLENQPVQPESQEDPQHSRSPGAEINKSKVGLVDVSILSF